MEPIKVNFNDWLTTPNRKQSEIVFPLSIEEKITIFHDGIDGWQLTVADIMINGHRDKSGTLVREPVPNSQYVALTLVLGFFETIAKYEKGYIGIHKSTYYFKEGVKLIFNELNFQSSEIIDKVLEGLYEWTRCGLCHAFTTNSKIFITNEFNASIALTEQGRLLINPHCLVANMREYLSNYTAKLRNPNNFSLRTNFEKRFDYDNSF
jgi:hypothetical protein